MSILGNDDEVEDQTNLWREKLITERAMELIKLGYWPPPVKWICDLLSPDWCPPFEDFWETIRPVKPPVTLICRDGERIDD